MFEFQKGNDLIILNIHFSIYLTTIRRRRSEFYRIIPGDEVEGIIRQYSLSLRRIIVLV